MGVANFYIKFNLNDKLKNIWSELQTDSLFECTYNNDNGENAVVLKCLFDNFLPTLLIIFNIFKKVDVNEILIETSGLQKKYILDNFENFVFEILKINKTKLIGYYQQMGYFHIDTQKYYKKRIKLKKYYKKIID